MHPCWATVACHELVEHRVLVTWPPSRAFAEVRLEVSLADSAIAFRSGDVPVLATPRVLALCEEATVAAITPHLEPGATSVGTRVELDHLRATPVGGEVTARAELIRVDDRVTTFRVDVVEGEAPVARGLVTRVVVDRARFLERLRG